MDALAHLRGRDVARDVERPRLAQPHHVRHFPKGVASFAVTHRTPFGEIRVAWRQANGRPEVETSVPPGVEVVR